MTTRDLSRGLSEVAAASPLFLFAPVYRHWHLRWGATDAEVAVSMPGDEVVSHPSFNATLHKCSIQARRDPGWAEGLRLQTNLCRAVELGHLCN